MVCSSDALIACKQNSGPSDDLLNCNATYGGFNSNADYLQSYVNDHIAQSFNYMLLSANFGTHVKNRPGFEKQFRGLSDNAWEQAIHLIKHITKRGGKHDFTARKSVSNQKRPILELDELNALALALDIEKSLAKEAHVIHEKYSHAAHPAHYDPEVAHYLEEEFFEQQASSVRKLSGYTNDLKRLIKDSIDTSLSVFMFDEYLQKQ